MPQMLNQIDPETRAEMAVLGTYPPEHWVNLHEAILENGLRSYAAATTLMAHMSHAEVRTLLAFLIGYDVENVRAGRVERPAEREDDRG